MHPERRERVPCRDVVGNNYAATRSSRTSRV